LENKRFIANAGDSDQKVPLTQEASIASNDLFTVAELPTTRAQHEHHLAAIKMTSMMVGERQSYPSPFLKNPESRQHQKLDLPSPSGFRAPPESRKRPLRPEG
jgi:hypothetical protein